MNAPLQREPAAGTHELPVTLHWLRQIDADAAEQIMALINCTVADGGTLGYQQAMSAEQCAEFTLALQGQMEQGDTHVLLGRSSHGPACLVILSRSGMPNCRHIATLSKGVVHPRQRGRGVVPQAFREIVALSRRIGVELLTLDVREGTRAHQLWSSLGFASFGVLEDYARVDGVSHRGHYMAQRVEALAARLGA